MKIQASKQLFSNPQTVHVIAIESLSALSFLFQQMTEVTSLRFLQNRCS